MSGYSGTPLAKKLGIAAGTTMFVTGAPHTYRASLAPIPADVKFAARPTRTTDIVHIFVTTSDTLAKALQRYRKLIKPSGVLWVSWPKKAAKVRTDVTEDTIRKLALPLGFVDVKVCAVDETWSGLKLVIRKELRAS